MTAPGRETGRGSDSASLVKMNQCDHPVVLGRKARKVWIMQSEVYDQRAMLFWDGGGDEGAGE